MKKIIVLCFLVFSTFGLLAKADLQQNCTDYYEKSPALIFYRQFFSPDACFLSVNPQDTMSMVFRSYLASNDGMFLVFNSYGPGDEALTTGAREYYFFPRTQIPDYVVDGNILTVKTASPKFAVNFNTTTGLIQSLVGATFTQAPSINPTNQGGIEITKYNGLMMDVGFARGHDPVLDTKRDVIFHDQTGAVCKIKNPEVFESTGNDVKIRFDTDDSLKGFLKIHCPQLKPLF